MILEGSSYATNVLMYKEIRPYPQMPQTPGGGELGSESYFRYALKESDYPTLTIPQPIYNGLGDVILPGFYTLALSDERDFLILIQSKIPIAIIPVFKLEDDGGAKAREDLNKKKNKRALKKEEKEIKKTNEQRAKIGMPPVNTKTYMEAEIYHENDGNYYLIKYERENIRAWGAIKG